MKQGKAHLLMLLLGVLIIASCKPRQAKDANHSNDVAKVVARHLASKVEFKTLVLKGKADLYDELKNENVSFTYKICIAKDSLIVGSISKLGLPAANMRLDHDSVKVRLPLTKEAILCDFRVVSSMVQLPMDFKTLQDFLVGDGKMGPNAKPEMPLKHPMVFEETNALGQVSYTVSSDHGKLEKMVVKDLNIARESSLEYGDFKQVKGQWVASTMKLTTTRPETTRIELKHTDIDIDSEDINFSFRIPENYEIKPCAGK